MKTEFCKVIAIIRNEALEKVEHHLQENGVRGFSVMQVKGCGEYTDFYSLDSLTTHARIEIFVSTERADTIAQAIIDIAYTGVEGDGLVAVMPVYKAYRIRHRAEMRPDEI